MSARESALDLSVNRKRRGVARASITRMRARISDLETKERSSPVDLETVRRLKQNLEDLDSDFKSHHYAIVDLIRDRGSDLYVGIDMVKNYCLYKWYGRCSAKKGKKLSQITPNCSSTIAIHETTHENLLSFLHDDIYAS